MSCLSTSLVSTKNFSVQSSFGAPLKSVDQCLGCVPTNLSFSTNRAGRRQISNSRRALTVQAGYSDDGIPISGAFVGGFILGGLLAGSLGCICAPQISRALAGADKQDLMRKLPKFIYDEEKALERTRKILTQKIEQLNSAIDNVSVQLRSEDPPNGVAVNPDELEAPV
ncbi:uncharacterized protein LOC132279020 [Cornus florida]|uniref:uncharacterized protein LOC132279020 n=1 Tax=Cornus florida TaxID=4283 RepID=UPI00289C60F0|nr:uncharacterized protein LOC132279020 [Cornus florida]